MNIGLVLKCRAFIHNCVIISLAQLVTEWLVVIVLIFLGIKMGNFCQQVLIH